MPSERAWSTLRGVYGWPRRNSWPLSGGWKPQMILIRVDLPEPLSPSRPRTSPLRSVRLTSRRAVIGPKRLETCSTRRTSSADAGPLPHASDVRVDGHREDDRQAQVEVQVVGVDALDGQAVAQDAEEERAEERADDAARPARQQRAADHRGRDAVEEDRVRARRVGLDGGGPHRLQHAHDRRARAAQHEVADE